MRFGEVNSPCFIPPMLPDLVDEPPARDEWTHEIKYDGYRTQLAIGLDDARAYTRRGHDWSERYVHLLDAAREIASGRTVLLDGEVIIQNAAGHSDFHGLRSAIHVSSDALVFMAFDLLFLGGIDLRRRPIEERRARLLGLLGDNRPSCPIQFSASVVGNGPMFFAQIEALNLEGIVSKKAGSKYRSGHALSWLKTKTFTEGELVVIGTEHEPGRPALVLLAWEDEGRLSYAGGAMVTLGGAGRDRFWEEMSRLAAPRPPLAMKKRSGVAWVLPALKVRVSAR
jgi:ATP-dependent DNA ligase